jgi:hypothetical protein
VTTIDFIAATLATWRLASLLTREDGPYALFSRLRGGPDARGLRRGLQCLYCTSLWVAAPLAWLLAPWSLRSIVTWLALSGGACLLDRATERTLDVLPLDVPDPRKGG